MAVKMFAMVPSMKLFFGKTPEAQQSRVGGGGFIAAAFRATGCRAWPFWVFGILLLGPAAWQSAAAEQAAREPYMIIGDIRGATGQPVEFSAVVRHLPAGTVAVEWSMHLVLPEFTQAVIRPGRGVPPNATVDVEPGEGGPPAFRFRVSAPEGEVLRGGELATVTLPAPGRMLQRAPVAVSAVRAVTVDGEQVVLSPPQPTIAFALFHDPIPLFALLAGCVGFIFWLGQLPALQGFFRYFPPLIWCYFVPMLMTTAGITPDASPLYAFMSRVVLPAVLVLLLMPSDVRGIARLGGKAVLMMLFATTGIVVGAVVSFTLFAKAMPGALPDDAWRAVPALAGSWIGGSANMVAVIESLGTPPGLIGPMVIVDTVLAYSWLGLLIALSAYQGKIDKYHRADSRIVDEISAHLKAEHAANARDPRIVDVALMFAVAFVVSQLCLSLGGPVHSFFQTILGWERFSEVINAFGWGILLITAAGLALSFTRLRALDYCGASSLGYVGLYLLLTTYGARANLRAILEVPVFFGIGFVWILIHIAFLYLGLRLLRVPLFLAATSSMANIGGTASAPVVAAAYNQSMAPVGLLMAIIGSVLGTPLALFVIATICRAVAP